jgi:hypothetical protein
MVIDLISFLFAFGTLLYVRVPMPKRTELGSKSRGSVWQEVLFGFRYINEIPSLRALTALFMVVGVFLAAGATLIAPLVLGGTGENGSALATVQSVGAVGGVVGAVLLSLWGGARKRIHNVLFGGTAACLLGIVWLGLGRQSAMWAAGSFFFSFFEPFVEGGNLAIWQAKVPADVQGRVLSARHLLVQIPYLFSILAAGFLADVFPSAVILVAAGLAGALVFASGYGIPQVCEAETLLADALETS